MPQSEGGFKLFKIGDLFDIETPKKRFNANTVEFGGKYPYVVRTSTNNGIRGYITESELYLNPANTISFGQDTATIFYQVQPYFTGDKIKVLTYKQRELNPNLAMYLMTVMRKAFSLFSWGVSSFDVKVLGAVDIPMPIKKNKEIDYKSIDKYVNALKINHICGLDAFLKSTGYTNCSLTPKERNTINKVAYGMIRSKSVRIVDFFDVTNSHNILKSDVVFDSGKTPYVTASEGNNSIVSYIDYKDDMKESGNSIMIGGKTLVITYQPTAFFSNDSHNLVLCAKEQQTRKENIQLFLVASLYKSLKPKYNWGDSISKAKIQNDTFVLPITSEGSIDYDFMDSYICAVKKQVIGGLLDFIRMGKETHS